MDVQCGWMNAYSQGRRSIKYSAYMWVVLLGTKVAHEEYIVDVSGCIILRTKVA